MPIKYRFVNQDGDCKVTNKSKLEKAFIDGLELAPGYEVQSLEYRQISEWDSIGHMALVAEIEDVFEVSLTTEQVMDLSSFSKAIEILCEKGVDNFNE
jgi:hypothetical protein